MWGCRQTKMVAHCLVRTKGSRHSKIIHRTFAVGLSQKEADGKGEVPETMRRQEPGAAVSYGKDYSILRTPGVETEAQIFARGTAGKGNHFPGSRSKSPAYPGRIFHTSGLSLGS
jgi:hypothetical protein